MQLKEFVQGFIHLQVPEILLKISLPILPGLLGVLKIVVLLYFLFFSKEKKTKSCHRVVAMGAIFH